MVTHIWVKIGSGNGLLPEGTKPLPEAMLTSSKVIRVTNLRAISQEMLKNFLCHMCSEITLLNLLPHPPGGNEFNTLRPRQNGRHFADDTFNRIFVNENI